MSATDKSFENWHTIRELGEGGQGKVYLAKRNEEFRELRQKVREVSSQLQQLIRAFETPGEHLSPPIFDPTDAMIRAIHQWEVLKDTGLGAIKDFKIPEGEPEASKAIKRFEKEVEALSSIQHPAILRLLDSNTKRFWMATEYHPGGKLSDAHNRERFKGKVLESLEAFRPLLEAARVLHDRGHVHRDIKPDNIFVANDGRLVLGDFGIVFYRDGKGERPTETYERVGTRDWMAPWANVPERLEDVRDSFDVFPLGKVLWAMISGKRQLSLWYHRRPEYDLERFFPEDPSMRMVNSILDQCVVEEERNCTLAMRLLEHVDQEIDRLRNGGDVLAKDVKRGCRVCGLGTYMIAATEEYPEAVKQVGFQIPQGSALRIYACDLCGHIQVFRFAGGHRPRVWRD